MNASLERRYGVRTDPIDGQHCSQTKERADTSRGQKRQNPCPSSLRASDIFVRVQQLISVHDNKLRSGLLLAFFPVVLRKEAN